MGKKIRRFNCPFCGHVHVFSPKESSKYKKRVTGFTCPRCGRKVTDKDITRKRGKGPKPPDQRRKRNKGRDRVEEVKPIEITPERNLLDTGIIEFRVNEPTYVPPSEAGHPGARLRINNPSYQPPPFWPPRQPTDRSLEEALLVGLHLVPSAQIPESILEEDCELEEMNEKKEALEDLKGKLEQHQKRLSIIIDRLDSVEQGFIKRVQDLETKNMQLETRLQTFSTLISQMETLLAHYDIKVDRRR